MAKKKIMAYYTSWNENYRADKIPFSKLTHIFHAFARQTAEGKIMLPEGFLEPGLTRKAHAADCQVVLSIGGGGLGSKDFDKLAADPKARWRFAEACAAICNEYGYDGVDIDWEYPLNETDARNYVSLVKEVRKKFNSSHETARLLITTAVNGQEQFGKWIYFEELVDYMDFFNLMAYDDHGPWSDHPGHNAPLKSGDCICPHCNESKMKYFLETRKIKPNQLCMGVPFYGYVFSEVDKFFTLNASCMGEYRTYAAIVGMENEGWEKKFDDKCLVPYMKKKSGPGIMSYDDQESIKAKVRFALKDHDNAGVFMWELSQDYIDGEQPLLEAMREEYEKYK